MSIALTAPSIDESRPHRSTASNSIGTGPKWNGRAMRVTISMGTERLDLDDLLLQV